MKAKIDTFTTACEIKIIKVLENNILVTLVYKGAIVQASVQELNGISSEVEVCYPICDFAATSDVLLGSP